jgi:hypothetical protein
MKTIFKDFLLYTLACIGAVSLLLSALDKPQQTTSTVAESHVWEMNSGSSNDYIYNKVTGKVIHLGKNHSGTTITLIP